MSLKPPKKSDLEKAWMQPRLDRSKKIQPEYHLIVTEGTDTEPAYFGAMSDIINSRYRGKIQLEVSGAGNNTLNLFKKARDRVVSFMQSDLHRSEYWPKLTEWLTGIGAGKYEKNRDDMYQILRPFMDFALANARRLAVMNKGKLPSQAAPGTQVYKIVEKLKPYL